MKLSKGFLWIILPLLLLMIILPLLFFTCKNGNTAANTPAEQIQAIATGPSKVQKTVVYKDSKVTYYGNAEVSEEQLMKESGLIDIADRRFESKWKAKDPVGISNEYTTDGVFMKPGVKPRIGKKEIAEEFASSVKGVERVEFFQDELEFYGDLTVAFQRCHMKGYIKDSDDIFYGSYVILWKKVNGNWLIHYDMFNADS